LERDLLSFTFFTKQENQRKIIEENMASSRESIIVRLVITRSPSLVGDKCGDLVHELIRPPGVQDPGEPTHLVTAGRRGI
jgi:hypothetical protein